MPPSSMSTLVLIGALVGDEAVGIARVAGERRALELDLELHQRAAFVDLRRDLEDGADFLALHRREGIHVAVGAAVAGVGELAGDERHFLRHLELGFLVVHRHRRGRGDDVGVRVALDRAQHGGEVHAAGRRCVRCRRWCRCRATDSAPLGLSIDCGQRGEIHATDRLLKRADRNARVVVVRPHGPVHAELGVLVHVDVDDDGLDQHLHAADVELVHDAHERAHDLGGRGDDQRVGFRLRPDGGGAIGAARPRRSWRRRRRRAVRPW